MMVYNFKGDAYITHPEDIYRCIITSEITKCSKFGTQRWSVSKRLSLCNDPLSHPIPSFREIWQLSSDRRWQPCRTYEETRSSLAFNIALRIAANINTFYLHSSFSLLFLTFFCFYTSALNFPIKQLRSLLTLKKMTVSQFVTMRPHFCNMKNACWWFHRVLDAFSR